jgi:hypothetical protein
MRFKTEKGNDRCMATLRFSISLVPLILLINLAQAADGLNDPCQSKCESSKSRFLTKCSDTQCQQQAEMMHERCSSACSFVTPEMMARSQDRKAARSKKNQDRKAREAALASSPLRPAKLTVVWSKETTWKNPGAANNLGKGMPPALFASLDGHTKETLDSTVLLELPDFVEHGMPGKNVMFQFSPHGAILISPKDLSARLVSSEGKATIYLHENTITRMDSTRGDYYDCSDETVMQAKAEDAVPKLGVLQLHLSDEDMSGGITFRVPVSGDIHSSCKGREEKGIKKQHDIDAGTGFGNTTRNGNTWEAVGSYDRTDPDGKRTIEQMRMRLEFH